MAEPRDRKFRPPPTPPATPTLNYSDPKVEREITRRWRRHRIEHLKSVIGGYGAAVLVAALIVLYFLVRITVWAKILTR